MTYRSTLVDWKMAGRKKISYTGRTVLVAVMALVLTYGLLGFVLLRQNRDNMKSLIDARMLDIVNVAADSVDGDVLRALNGSDAGNMLYRRVYNQLRLFYDNIELEYIYAVNLEPDGSFTFSVDPSDDPGIFGEPVVATEALRTAAAGSAAVDAKPYTDAWGRFYSAYAPVFDSRGDVAAVIAVDFAAEWYDDQLRSATLSTAVLTFLCIVFGGGVAFIFAGGTRRRLDELGAEMSKLAGDMEDLTAEISREELGAASPESDAPAEVRVPEDSDEIAALGAKISTMQQELRDYLVYTRARAYTDPLTGLASRAAYLDTQAAVQRRMDDGTAGFSVTVFDVDDLKTTNDRFGHAAGDRLIADCAAAMAAAFGLHHLYRIGGDEFVAVRAFGGPTELAAWNAALEEELARRRSEDPERPLGLSWGSAVYDPETDREYQSVFQRADAAMYEMKQAHHAAAGQWARG
jgi:diguanylate cyclase (GGDEF)-like protein